VPIVHDPEQAEILAITALVPSFHGRRVLEVGCGDGRLTRRYAADAASVTAIDSDAQAISECRAAVRAPHVQIHALPFERFTGPSGASDRYDIVILAWSL
jgi:2-polyprenyl-3-methyl-5-hydroxy-6-metoxy-1,4-benzoquinol methylase